MFVGDVFLLILLFRRCFYSLGKFTIGNATVQLFKDHILIFQSSSYIADVPIYRSRAAAMQDHAAKLGTGGLFLGHDMFLAMYSFLNSAHLYYPGRLELEIGYLYGITTFQ